jgi:hypothetical protein
MSDLTNAAAIPRSNESIEAENDILDPVSSDNEESSSSSSHGGHKPVDNTFLAPRVDDVPIPNIIVLRSKRPLENLKGAAENPNPAKRQRGPAPVVTSRNRHTPEATNDAVDPVSSDSGESSSSSSHDNYEPVDDASPEPRSHYVPIPTTIAVGGKRPLGNFYDAVESPYPIKRQRGPAPVVTSRNSGSAGATNVTLNVGSGCETSSALSSRGDHESVKNALRAARLHKVPISNAIAGNKRPSENLNGTIENPNPAERQRVRVPVPVNPRPSLVSGIVDALSTTVTRIFAGCRTTSFETHFGQW